MHDDIVNNGLNVILVQIDEAHSSAWPMALPDQPEPQTSFLERMERARMFVEKYKCPIKVYVDGWDNVFENTFRAWPDKYHCVEHYSISNHIVEKSSDNIEYRIVAKSEYHRSGNKEAVIVTDYTNVLKDLIESKGHQRSFTPH